MLSTLDENLAEAMDRVADDEKQGKYDVKTHCVLCSGFSFCANEQIMISCSIWCTRK